MRTGRSTGILLATFAAACCLAWPLATRFSRRLNGKNLPPPGPKKRDPAELDRMLDTALEDSMVASDPPSTTQPEVKP